MKKQLLLLGLIVGLSIQLLSQTTSDVGKIINTCIVEKSLIGDLQQKSSTNQIFTLESNLVDLSSYQTKLPQSLSVSPAFKTKEEVITKQAESYYEWIFDFSSDKSVIVMVFKRGKSSKDVPWTFRMEKIADNWVVQEELQN